MPKLMSQGNRISETSGTGRTSSAQVMNGSSVSEGDVTPKIQHRKEPANGDFDTADFTVNEQHLQGNVAEVPTTAQDLQASVTDEYEGPDDETLTQRQNGAATPDDNHAPWAELGNRLFKLPRRRREYIPPGAGYTAWRNRHSFMIHLHEHRYDQSMSSEEFLNSIILSKTTRPNGEDDGEDVMVEVIEELDSDAWSTTSSSSVRQTRQNTSHKLLSRKEEDEVSIERYVAKDTEGVDERQEAAYYDDREYLPLRRAGVDVTLDKPISHERERALSRRDEHDGEEEIIIRRTENDDYALNRRVSDDEIIIRRDEEEGGRGGDRIREEIIIRKRSRSRSSSPVIIYRESNRPQVVREGATEKSNREREEIIIRRDARDDHPWTARSERSKDRENIVIRSRDRSASPHYIRRRDRSVSPRKMLAPASHAVLSTEEKHLLDIGSLEPPPAPTAPQKPRESRTPDESGYFHERSWIPQEAGRAILHSHAADPSLARLRAQYEEQLLQCEISEAYANQTQTYIAQLDEISLNDYSKSVMAEKAVTDLARARRVARDDLVNETSTAALNKAAAQGTKALISNIVEITERHEARRSRRAGGYGKDIRREDRRRAEGTGDESTRWWRYDGRYDEVVVREHSPEYPLAPRSGPRRSARVQSRSRIPRPEVVDRWDTTVGRASVDDLEQRYRASALSRGMSLQQIRKVLKTVKGTPRKADHEVHSALEKLIEDAPVTVEEVD